MMIPNAQPTQPTPMSTSRGLSQRITGSITSPWDRLPRREWKASHHFHPTTTTQHCDTAQGFDPSHPRNADDIHDAVSRERMLERVRSGSRNSSNYIHRIFYSAEPGSTNDDGKGEPEAERKAREMVADRRKLYVPGPGASLSYAKLRTSLASNGVQLSN